MQILSRIRAPNLAGAPTSPATGEMYFDTGTSTLYWWSGSAWVPAKDTGGGAQALRWTFNAAKTNPNNLVAGECICDTTLASWSGNNYVYFHRTTLDGIDVLAPGSDMYRLQAGSLLQFIDTTRPDSVWTLTTTFSVYDDTSNPTTAKYFYTGGWMRTGELGTITTLPTTFELVGDNTTFPGSSTQGYVLAAASNGLKQWRTRTAVVGPDPPTNRDATVLWVDSDESSPLATQPCVFVAMNADISVTTAVYTLVNTWNTVIEDTLGFRTSASRLTVPTGLDGLYLCSLSLWFAANATGSRYARVLKNAAGAPGANATPGTEATQPGNAVGLSTIMTLTFPIRLIGGDYLEAAVYQNSGGALVLQGAASTSRFGLVRLSG